jgi:hypothetical protein
MIDLPKPDELWALPREAIPIVLGQLSALQSALIARLLEIPAATSNNQPRRDDTLLNLKQAAELIGQSRKFFYRHPNLPFLRKIGGKWMVSKNGLEIWIECQKP